MGTRYILTLNCVFCQAENEDVYYAPTCGFFSFNCCNCSRENWIEHGCHAVGKETPEAMENRLLNKEEK